MDINCDNQYMVYELRYVRYCVNFTICFMFYSKIIGRENLRPPSNLSFLIFKFCNHLKEPVSVLTLNGFPYE